MFRALVESGRNNVNVADSTLNGKPNPHFSGVPVAIDIMVAVLTKALHFNLPDSAPGFGGNADILGNMHSGFSNSTLDSGLITGFRGAAEVQVDFSGADLNRKAA